MNYYKSSGFSFYFHAIPSIDRPTCALLLIWFEISKYCFWFHRPFPFEAASMRYRFRAKVINVIILIVSLCEAIQVEVIDCIVFCYCVHWQGKKPRQRVSIDHCQYNQFFIKLFSVHRIVFFFCNKNGPFLLRKIFVLSKRNLSVWQM